MNDGRVAIVTGASRGLGKEICRQLKAVGCEVLLTARNQASGQQAAEELGIKFFPLDVLDPSATEDLYRWIDASYGRLDILVNNAGILLDAKQRLLTSTSDILRESLATNALAPVELFRKLMPLMLKSKHPRVVNVTTRLSQSKSWGLGAPSYRISKLALNATTAILAMELEGTPIKINAASPGWVRTHMGGDDAPNEVEQGAKVVIDLALLPDDGPSGRFFEGERCLEW